MTNPMDRLEKMIMVKRRSDPKDRRVVLCELTDGAGKWWKGMAGLPGIGFCLLPMKLQWRSVAKELSATVQGIILILLNVRWFTERLDTI